MSLNIIRTGNNPANHNPYPDQSNPTPTTPLPMTVKLANGLSRGIWKKVAIGAGTGLVFGTAATILTSMTGHGGPQDEAYVEPSDAEQIYDVDESVDFAEPVVSDPEPQAVVVGDNVSVASGVSDDMSFAQAFNEARAELGPGGVFEWHGQLFGTYTTEEWDAMNQEQQQAFNDDFAFAADDAIEAVPADGLTDDDDISAFVADDFDDIDGEEIQPIDDDYDIFADMDDEVEVLGIVSDDDSIPATVNVDDQDVFFIDVNDDSLFDSLDDDSIPDPTALDDLSYMGTDDMDYINDANIDAFDA